MKRYTPPFPLSPLGEGWERGGMLKPCLKPSENTGEMGDPTKVEDP